jgi:hypothetical protein
MQIVLSSLLSVSWGRDPDALPGQKDPAARSGARAILQWETSPAP